MITTAEPLMIMRVRCQDSLIIIWISLTTGDVLSTTLLSYN